tara:strand:- start:5672 stop:7426 length:1755 start_codon:yes stop_codon:yes gene_type:complete
MKINSISIKLFFGLMLPFLGWSQGEEKDNLGIQQVTVTKSYSPSLSNVFKIRSKPEVNDSLSKKKLGVNYTFLSLPVISTFVPNKASPLKLQKQEATFFYNSYVSGGLGNKSSFLLDAAMMLPLDRSQGLGFDFRRSAVSGVEGTLLPSDQSRTTLNLLHQYKTKSLNVNSDFRFDRQNHNFYGISEGDRTNFDSSPTDNTDAKQHLNYLSIRSKWQWYESPFSKLYFNTSITTDYFDTTENILKINTQMRFPLFGKFLEVTPGFQLVNTDFKTAYYSDEPLSFKEGLTDLEIQFLNIGKKLKFRVGTHAFYALGNDNKKSAVFVYPKFELSYSPKSQKMIPFINYQGHYDLNSFTSFSLQNPYVSPTLRLESTEVLHEGKIGFNATPGSGLRFRFAAVYSKSNRHPLFKRLPFDLKSSEVPFRLANTYGIVYDEIEKKGLETSISLRFNENNKLTLETRYSDYQSTVEKHAWNLPAIEIDLKGNFRFGQKLFVQFIGNYIGKREVAAWDVFLNQPLEDALEGTATLSDVFSIFSNVTYKLNSSWDVFYEAKVRLGKETARWAHYENHSQLHLVGIRYKFDLNL